jgi:peptidoglycan/xylan/chitin deacetylase (PgdA/CDA1 family)
MFHRFSSSNEQQYNYFNSSLFVSKYGLEKLIITCLKLGFEFCDLSTKNLLKPKTIYITIDDGYVDFLDNALPIFEKYGIPFTIFVNKKFVKKEALAWWEAIELLSNTQREKVRTFVSKILTVRDLEISSLRENILELDHSDFVITLEFLMSLLNLNQKIKLQNLFMDVRQLTTLSKNPLCMLGCHSVSHFNLTKLSPPTLRKEIIDDYDFLKQITHNVSKFFCIPYGSPKEFNTEILLEIRACGFEYSLTSCHGALQRRLPKSALRRLYVSPNFGIKQLLFILLKENMKDFLNWVYKIKPKNN